MKLTLALLLGASIANAGDMIQFNSGASDTAARVAADFALGASTKATNAILAQVGVDTKTLATADFNIGASTLAIQNNVGASTAALRVIMDGISNSTQVIQNNVGASTLTLTNIKASTGTNGDITTMTALKTLTSSMTFTNGAFSVGDSTFNVSSGNIGFGTPATNYSRAQFWVAQNPVRITPSIGNFGNHANTLLGVGTNLYIADLIDNGFYDGNNNYTSARLWGIWSFPSFGVTASSGSNTLQHVGIGASVISITSDGLPHTVLNQKSLYVLSPQSDTSTTVTEAYGIYIDTISSAAGGLSKNHGIYNNGDSTTLGVTSGTTAAYSGNVGADSFYITGSGNVRLPSDSYVDLNGGGTGASRYALRLAAGATPAVSLYSGSDSPRMIINNSGNVGIGTASPGYTLDVNGTSNFAGSVAHKLAGANWVYGNVTSNYLHTGTGALYISDAADVNVRMTVLDGGNVGIGTTSPCSTCTLHVEGNINASGVIGSKNGRVPVGLYISVASTASPAAAGEMDIYKYTLPANTLAADGDAVHIVCMSSTTTASFSKDMLVYFDDQIVVSGVSTGAQQLWKSEGRVVRASATTWKGYGERRFDTSSTAKVNLAGTFDATVATEIRCAAKGGGTAADMIGVIMKVTYEPAP
jgi:hypothetical protein